MVGVHPTRLNNGDIEKYENNNQNDVEENKSKSVPKNKGKGKVIAVYSSDAEFSFFEHPPASPASLIEHSSTTINNDY